MLWLCYIGKIPAFDLVALYYIIQAFISHLKQLYLEQQTPAVTVLCDPYLILSMSLFSTFNQLLKAKIFLSRAATSIRR